MWSTRFNVAGMITCVGPMSIQATRTLMFTAVAIITASFYPITTTFRLTTTIQCFTGGLITHGRRRFTTRGDGIQHPGIPPYAYYFSPYPAYPSAAFWLTD